MGSRGVHLAGRVCPGSCGRSRGRAAESGEPAGGRPGSVVRRREEAGGGRPKMETPGPCVSLCLRQLRGAGRQPRGRTTRHATPQSPPTPSLPTPALRISPRRWSPPADLQPAPLVDSSLPTRLRLDLDATTPSKPEARNDGAVPTSRRSRAVSTAPGSAHRARALHKPRRGRHLAGRCLALFNRRVRHNLPARLHSTKSSPAAGLGEREVSSPEPRRGGRTCRGQRRTAPQPGEGRKCRGRA